MSTSAITAQGSIIEIGGVPRSGDSITAITGGFPTVITATAHGLTNGEVVTIVGVTGTDAWMLNNNAYTVSNVTTDTFAINVDTTGKIDFSGGTAVPQMWTAINGVKSFKPGEPTVDDIESTDLSSTVKEFRPGLADYKELTLEMMYILDDPGQIALYLAYLNKDTKNIRIRIPSGEAFTFTGYINKCGLPDGAVSAISNFSASMKVTQAVDRA